MVLYVFNVYSITSCAPVLVIRAQLSSLGFHCFLRVCMGSCVCFLRVHVCSGVGSGRCVCQVAPRGSRWETARYFLGHLVLRPHTHNSSIAMSAPAHTPYPFWLTGHPHGRGGRAWLVLVASAARCRVECVNARSCTRQTRRTPGNTHAPHVWLAMRPALLLLTSHVVHLLCIRHHRQGSKRVGATLQLHTASHTCSRKARSRSSRSPLSRPLYSFLSYVLFYQPIR